jgi:hypothetical protein
MTSNEISGSVRSAVRVDERRAADAPQELERFRQQPVERGIRISRAFFPVARARGRACASYDSSFADPDMVENDYYRFRNHPRN